MSAASPPPTSVPVPSQGYGPISVPPPSSTVGAIDSRSADFNLPTLRDALLLRVRVGQGGGPLWAFALLAVVAALGAVALTSSLFSAVLARSTAPSPSVPETGSAAPAASTSASAPAAVEKPPAKPERFDATELAARGDKLAMAQLAERPAAERTVGQIVALASGRAVEKQRALEVLRDRAAKDEEFATSSELAAQLKDAVSDPDTTRTALAVMAQLPGSLGPDLLYALSTSRRRPDAVTELAAELLTSKTVGAKASDALKALLDLKQAESCEQAKGALERAAEHADRRAVSTILRFGNKRGCGDGKSEDCWPCLRDGDAVKAATRTAAKRAAPRW